MALAFELSPWPEPARPELRLVTAPQSDRTSTTCTRSATYTPRSAWSVPSRPSDFSPARHGHRSATVELTRRAKIVIGVLVGAVVLALSLPLSGLGGAAVNHGSPLVGSTQAGHQVVYTVQRGDSLWSIAQRLAPNGDPRAIVAELTSELGSSSIVPGERLVLP